MLVKAANRPIDLPADMAPLLTVIIDTEEEFDWDQPFSRDNVAVESIATQLAAQEIFARYGIVPTYVIDYPVAATESAVSCLKPLMEAGACEIGAHLHPWVSPPYEEEVCALNSYPGNLAAELERSKLVQLTDTIERNFGRRPTVYKAGRYGVGPNTASILAELGYEVDVSVVPYTAFTNDGGPDFRDFAFQPYWFGDDDARLLELPLSCGFYGALSSLGQQLFPLVSGPLGLSVRLPGILSRSHMLERIRLSPEGANHAEHRRLTKSLMKQGCRMFSFTYHSPSLAVGHTPYVRSEAELRGFLDSLDRYFDFFMNELGGKPTTPASFRAQLNESAPAATPSQAAAVAAGA
ncbi:polysaccharide deacetylase family protein [Pelagibius sp. Alg239-R121]|uniref:polysaccharide deacetylase family protein n=1 Tax=Pelagibius sp. Alg239-R121 TaxID=2993448 RepID=UPI0024A799D7|nr:polysaccharide deacetylase family protein [Pelagibius sp. Alg239-R121]